MSRNPLLLAGQGPQKSTSISGKNSNSSAADVLQVVQKQTLTLNGQDMDNTLKREPIEHNLHHSYVHLSADEHFRVRNLNITSNHQDRGKVLEQPTSLEYNCEDIPTISRRQDNMDDQHLIF